MQVNLDSNRKAFCDDSLEPSHPSRNGTMKLFFKDFQSQENVEEMMGIQKLSRTVYYLNSADMKSQSESINAQSTFLPVKTLLVMGVAVLISIVVLKAVQSESIPAFIDTTRIDIAQSVDSSVQTLERFVSSLAYFSEAVEFVIRMTILYYFK